MVIKTDAAGFDIIGDVHGCADALKALLTKLGYECDDTCYSFQGESKRQAVFVGDLIDRGSQIVETLAIVKAMVDAGHAYIVLGNHEFNALAYHTPIQGGYLRPRNTRSDKQIKDTLEQFSDCPSLWEEYLQWFSQLPLFLEFEGFRVVHACWDQSYINGYLQTYGTHCLTDKALADCEHYQSAAGLAVERLTRGISLALPKDKSIIGRDGFERKSFRVHFWADNPQNYQDVVFQPDPLPENLQHQELNNSEKRKLISYKSCEKPLFVGHYWLDGEPTLMAKNIACLDYSAVNSGKLVAYQFDMQQSLDAANFVAVDCPKV